jgi:glycosyltransferase involved in cell wall biosynthesis
MVRTPRSILIDARVNGLAGAHGLARSVLKLAAHMGQSDDGLVLRVLVNPNRAQLFPLSALPSHADVISTDITLGAVHRCRELARLIRSSGAAVLYVPYPTFTPFIRPCPIVVTIHDCTIESDVGFAGGRHRQAALKLVTRAVLRRAAAATAPTQASLAEVRRYYPAAPHLTLVPNGVDISQFAAVTADAVSQARRRYQLPGRFVLTIGAHRPHKNHEVLIRALPMLPTDISLVIVGYFDSSFPDPLPRLIAELGLQARVRLVPEVADEWLPAVYRAASVFAFPSLAEGYGLPVLEAMAVGVPVVASDIPALAEVAGSAAILVPPRDVDGWAAALAAILADAAMAARLSGAGAVVADAVSWERGASTLRGLLGAVATGALGSSRPDPSASDPLAADGTAPDSVPGGPRSKITR